MTTLEYDAATFSADALAGFLAAHPQVQGVDGGVVRRGARPDGAVSVVIGGGSGHYPAFAGLVGPGLATGAAYGNVFASPSAGQVHRVARATERGGGVLLAFGNYAGDVLNFGLAAERLRGEGLDVRVVAVTDDVASAAADDVDRRRGIAGDLVVFKVAGAAAEEGLDLDAVETLARQANARTRSFGVAFSGCTLPGATEPLFTVPEGVMSVGLGIHGEPGISEDALPSCEQLAELLVAPLLAERPDGAGDRAVVLLNGLGTFKYEELFALYGHVASRLADAGVAIVAPEVGELVTSLDMAGVSATLCWVDDDLERLWVAPATTPAFVRTVRAAAGEDAGAGDAPVARTVGAPPDPRHADVMPALVDVLTRVRDTVVDAEDEFGRLDAVAGDGDHGIGMSRGVRGATAAARAALERGAGVGPLLAEAGDGWSEDAGGTSGALWGAVLTSAGVSLAGEPRLDTTGASARAARAALDAVQRLGRAEVGDKTMVDAFAPLVASLTAAADQDLAWDEGWEQAATAAEAAARATAGLRPRMGRARPLAEKSIGHPDAGAVSFARIARVVADHICAHRGGTA